jgi:hypothetical protein
MICFRFIGYWRRLAGRGRTWKWNRGSLVLLAPPIISYNLLAGRLNELNSNKEMHYATVQYCFLSYFFFTMPGPTLGLNVAVSKQFRTLFQCENTKKKHRTDFLIKINMD